MGCCLGQTSRQIFSSARSHVRQDLAPARTGAVQRTGVWKLQVGLEVSRLPPLSEPQGRHLEKGSSVNEKSAHSPLRPPSQNTRPCGLDNTHLPSYSSGGLETWGHRICTEWVPSEVSSLPLACRQVSSPRVLTWPSLCVSPLLIRMPVTLD